MGPPAHLARVYFNVQGRVQGVYFRASAVQRAQELGLTGWVKNCADGSVEGVAEGPREKLENLVAWCGQGPTGAKVTNLETRWDAAQNAFSAFTIER
jgi:acylphosphatase